MVAPLTSFLVIGFSACVANARVSNYDALVLLQSFTDHFLAPANVEVAKSINSTLFAEDVR